MLGSPPGAVEADGELPPALRLQSAPPYALHPRPTGDRGDAQSWLARPAAAGKPGRKTPTVLRGSHLPPTPAGAVYYPVGFVYPGFYMAQGGADPRAAEADDGSGGLGGGLAMGSGQQLNGLGRPPHTIDALKARVMDAGPGEVKALIAASRLPLR